MHRTSYSSPSSSSSSLSSSSLPSSASSSTSPPCGMCGSCRCGLWNVSVYQSNDYQIISVLLPGWTRCLVAAIYLFFVPRCPPSPQTYSCMLWKESDLYIPVRFGVWFGFSGTRGRTQHGKCFSAIQTEENAPTKKKNCFVWFQLKSHGSVLM